MRKRGIGLHWALIVGVSLVATVSCDDKSGGQSAPQEYDPQIDSVATAPLPTIVIGMAEGVSGNEAEGGSRIRLPDGYRNEETINPVSPVESEAIEPSTLRSNPADPNTFKL